ncbi:MAG: T9SS type A sorting domain-containing protein [Bacteroidetes bacterium]|nr:MAG: T9SS type A sorting domain-containing protein [Bacteroidota bacterium]
MKLIFTLVSVLYFSTSFSQWTRVQQLPSSDIFTVYHKDNILYAGGKKIIYVSKDEGQTWDSTATIPSPPLINNIIVYKDELYAASAPSGVFKSSDGGLTWQNIRTGLLFPDISDFCEFKGDLYAATLGNSVYKLDPVSKNKWLFFGNGLSDLSANLNCIAGNSNALVAGTNANGIYDYLPANSTTWEERLLSGQISPNEKAYDIVTAHDTLFYASGGGRFYMSTDDGFTWQRIGNSLPTAATNIVNAKQALIKTRYIFNGSSNTLFYFIKKDALQDPFVNFSVVFNHFSYKIDILDNRLWDASTGGLFYMSLSTLPDISAVDASPLTQQPVLFTLFNAKCDNKKVLLTWRTALEQNSSHFDIEKSEDGIHWSVIGSLPASGNSNSEKSYSFMDNNSAQNNYYRIVEFDLNGSPQFTSIIQSTCSVTTTFKLWPNPVRDKSFINITTETASQVMINIFDSKGSLVKMQRDMILQGSNQLNVDMKPLTSGIYLISIDWNNGQMKKTVQVWKQ